MAISLWARLLFGFSLLLSAIFVSGYTHALITLLIATMTMVVLKQPSLLWRAFRYLRWLLLPVILLHLVFSPGMLLAPSLPWSPSREGVDVALWQSLRLINWFLSGWLLAYLLSHHEWQYLLTRLPKVGHHWTTLLIALPPMLHRSQQMLMQMRWRWRMERGKWRDIPSVATSMVVMVLAQGTSQAEAHWLSHQSSTPTRPQTTALVVDHPPYAWIQTVLVGAGWTTLWMIW